MSESLLTEEYLIAGNELLDSVSVSQKDAEIIMASLLDADLKGINTHGVFRLPRYMEQLSNGHITAKPEIKAVRSNAIMEVLDGDHGPGSVVAKEAMERALQKSRQLGVGVTAVRNGNHFGVAAYYAEMAAMEGKVGIVLTNSSPAIAPTGSIKRLIGNNPWSISVPHTPHPITLDMANSISSKGKLRVAMQKGEKIPYGWALDSEGNPTDDPQKALEGIVLPIGDYKGYGIALMVEILSGVLTGSDFSESMVDHDANAKRNVGHLFIVLDVAQLMSLDEYKQRLTILTSAIHSAPRIPGKHVYLPGEIEWETKQGQREGEVRVPQKTVQSFIDLCERYGVTPPAVRRETA